MITGHGIKLKKIANPMNTRVMLTIHCIKIAKKSCYEEPDKVSGLKENSRTQSEMIFEDLPTSPLMC